MAELAINAVKNYIDTSTYTVDTKVENIIISWKNQGHQPYNKYKIFLLPVWDCWSVGVLSVMVTIQWFYFCCKSSRRLFLPKILHWRIK